MKRKLLETIRKHRVSPEWKKWQDVPSVRRGECERVYIAVSRGRLYGILLTCFLDALRELCPHLFLLRTLMAQSLDAEIAAPAQGPNKAPSSTRDPLKSSKAHSSSRQVRDSPGSPNGNGRPHVGIPPSDIKARSVSASSRKRKHEMTTVIVVSDDSDVEGESKVAAFEPKQRHGPINEGATHQHMRDAAERRKRRKKRRAGEQARAGSSLVSKDISRQ